MPIAADLRVCTYINLPELQERFPEARHREVIAESILAPKNEGVLVETCLIAR